MSDNKTIGVGIIGLGVRGFYCIGMNMAQLCHETGFRIAALCDRNSARMEKVRDVLVGTYASEGASISPRLYDNGLDLMDAREVDLVVITSITDTHREFAVPALFSGRKVYCDKPLAQNVEDAVAIVEAEAEADNPLIMGVYSPVRVGLEEGPRIAQGWRHRESDHDPD
ncbi:MAG: Gfo/Idh/MocA family oxidoreductase [Anaerolineae bacterium]|jgi:myo-inositol 2-dehydrogenase/D-chiro-inositol 1-dehydrogenase